MAKSPRIIFSASAEDVARLKELSQAWGMSEASVLRKLLRMASRGPGGAPVALVPASLPDGANSGVQKKNRPKPAASR